MAVAAAAAADDAPTTTMQQQQQQQPGSSQLAAAVVNLVVPLASVSSDAHVGDTGTHVGDSEGKAKQTGRANTS